MKRFLAIAILILVNERLAESSMQAPSEDAKLAAYFKENLDEEMKHNPAWAEAEADMDKKFNSFLFVDTIVPNLKNLGLMNERTEPRYRDLGVLEMYAG